MSAEFIIKGQLAQQQDILRNLGTLLALLRAKNDRKIIHVGEGYLSEKHLCKIYEISDGLRYALPETWHWSIFLDQ